MLSLTEEAEGKQEHAMVPGSKVLPHMSSDGYRLVFMIEKTFTQPDIPVVPLYDATNDIKIESAYYQSVNFGPGDVLSIVSQKWEEYLGDPKVK